TAIMSSTSATLSSLRRTPALPSRPTAASQAAPTVASMPSNGMPRQTPKRSPASDAGSSAVGASPAITASANAHSATVLAIGPMESSVNDKGNAPSVGTRRLLGFQPTSLHRAAGM